MCTTVWIPFSFARANPDATCIFLSERDTNALRQSQKRYTKSALRIGSLVQSVLIGVVVGLRTMQVSIGLVLTLLVLFNRRARISSSLHVASVINVTRTALTVTNSVLLFRSVCGWFELI